MVLIVFQGEICLVKEIKQRAKHTLWIWQTQGREVNYTPANLIACSKTIFFTALVVGCLFSHMTIKITLEARRLRCMLLHFSEGLVGCVTAANGAKELCIFAGEHVTLPVTDIFQNICCCAYCPNQLHLVRLLLFATSCVPDCFLDSEFCRS